MKFFVGLHQPSDAKHFQRCFVSVNRLRNRKSGFQVNEWIMDSGAFTTLEKHGCYPYSVAEYAEQILRWKNSGNLLAAVTQDYMCEPFMLAKTGLTVAQHQRLTIKRYDALLAADTGVYIMPVLQGYDPEDYVSHIRQYRYRLSPGAWVGVGSVCKRNTNPCIIIEILFSIKTERPDLNLHCFGLKLTALTNGAIQQEISTCDSMSWSYYERKQGRSANDWRGAQRFVREIESRPIQYSFLRQIQHERTAA